MIFVLCLSLLYVKKQALEYILNPMNDLSTVTAAKCQIETPKTFYQNILASQRYS